MTRHRSWKKKLSLSFVTLVLAATIAWTVSAVVRTNELYDGVKGGWRGWSGNVHGSDAELGLRLVPGGSGAETFPIGPDVKSRIDAAGFRVPFDAPPATRMRRPIVLALGCSFTYGAACAAEDTFAWKVAEDLDGTALNAGICSAGAAQMLILAERLIPEHKPDVVLVQYAPWLLDRSTNPFAPTNMGLIPSPWFVRTQDGIAVHPPAFDTLAFDLPIAHYKETPRGFADFMGFFFRVGLPLLWHDDRHLLALRTELAFGARPPAATMDEIAAEVWPRIAELCREHGARMVVVWFEGRKPETGWDLPPILVQLEAQGVPIARATQRLLERLTVVTRQGWLDAYAHMRGDPPVCVDAHPNERAHAIVAEEILRALGSGE